MTTEKLVFGREFDLEAFTKHLEEEKAEIRAQGRNPDRFREGKKQRIRSQWSGKPVSEMAALVDAHQKPEKDEQSLSWHYHTIYWQGSNLSHSNPKSLHHYFDDANGRFISGPSENLCLQTILPATSLFYRLLWLFATETGQGDLEKRLSSIMLPGSLQK